MKILALLDNGKVDMLKDHLADTADADLAQNRLLEASRPRRGDDVYYTGGRDDGGQQRHDSGATAVRASAERVRDRHRRPCREGPRPRRSGTRVRRHSHQRRPRRQPLPSVDQSGCGDALEPPAPGRGADRAGIVVTIAAVDEGILQLIAQKTPDPHAYFYRKLALGVTTNDIFAELLPEVKPRGRANTGGGEDMEGLAQYVRADSIRRAKPVATGRARLWPMPTAKPARHSTSPTSRAACSDSGRHINNIRNTRGLLVWQRSFYDHIIRDEEDLQARTRSPIHSGQSTKVA